VSVFLDPADIRKLTARERVADQIKVLQTEGIPFRQRIRGGRIELLVLVCHAADYIAGRTTTPTRRPNIAAAAS
jgi:hypothetical protein